MESLYKIYETICNGSACGVAIPKLLSSTSEETVWGGIMLFKGLVSNTLPIKIKEKFKYADQSQWFVAFSKERGVSNNISLWRRNGTSYDMYVMPNNSLKIEKVTYSWDEFNKVITPREDIVYAVPTEYAWICKEVANKFE